MGGTGLWPKSVAPRQAAADGPWYHGTYREFRPDELVSPGQDPTFGTRNEVTENQPVYMSSNRHAAGAWAEEGIESRRRRGEDVSAMRPRVYQVTPTGHHYPDDSNEDEFTPDYVDHASGRPLRVVREVPFDSSRAPWRQPGYQPGRPLASLLDGKDYDLDLYHHTDPESARDIARSGVFRSEVPEEDERDVEPHAYFSSREDGSAAEDYGAGAYVHVRVPSGIAKADDYTPSGETFYKIPTRLLRRDHIIGVHPIRREAAAWSPSSGIFAPTTGLDPQLFEGGSLRPMVRAEIMERLDRCIRVDVQLAGSDWQQWLRVWIAGGSASEWAGGRPNDVAQDLDVLVGVDLPKAQEFSSFEGMDAQQAATALNAAFRGAFNDPQWQPPSGGTWSLTAYCNPLVGSDITAIRPYAAWDLTGSRWAVRPPHLPGHTLADFDPATVAHARAVLAEARAVLRMAEPLRTREARALWEHIHEHRCEAFSAEGTGWDDPGNVDEKMLAYAPRGVLSHIRDLALGDTAFIGKVSVMTARSGTRMIDLYHRTDPEHAEAITQERKFIPADDEDDDQPYVYFSDRARDAGPNTALYGPSIVHVRLPRARAEHWDEMEDGENHYRVPEDRILPDHIIGVDHTRGLVTEKAHDHPDMAAHLINDHGVQQPEKFVRSIGEQGARDWHGGFGPHSHGDAGLPEKTAAGHGTMPIADVLALPSVDSPTQTVAEVLPSKTGDYWRGSLAGGPPGVPPVHIAPAEQMAHDYRFGPGAFALNDIAADSPGQLMLGNGHHRVREMQAVGWTRVPWTSDMAESDRMPDSRTAAREEAAENPPCRYCEEPLDDEDVCDGQSAHEECEDMRWCHACYEHHDDPQETDNHNETYTDWGGHLPFEHGVHRGTTIRLPSEVHVVVHDEARPHAERAGALAAHLRENPIDHSDERGHAGGYGLHWTDHEPTARAWGTGEGAMFGPSEGEHSSPAYTHVVMHAASPHEDHIQTDPRVLDEGNLLGYDHARSEREIPLRAEAPVRMTGLSWKRADQPEWHRHDFPESGSRVAAREDAWEDEDENTDRYVTCDQGHDHWGAAGAAGLLVRHRGDDGQDRYLLQHRSPYVQHGGTWSTPGGALARGEEPEEGARREAEEEFGSLPHGLKHHHTFSDNHGGWAYHTVVMDSPRQFSPHGGGEGDWETQGHGWFTPEEMKGLQLHPGFAASWAKVRKSGAAQPGLQPWMEWAASGRPHKAVIWHAQERTREEHPELTEPLPEPDWEGFSKSGEKILHRALVAGGYPPGHADRTFVMMHGEPDGNGTSQVAMSGSRFGVAIHPRSWHPGTIAHEGAHLLDIRYRGIHPLDQMTDREMHGPEFAGHYATTLNAISPGAGDDFRRHYADATQLVGNYRSRVHGLPRDLDGGIEREAAAGQGRLFHASDQVLAPGTELLPPRAGGRVFMAGDLDDAREWAETIGKRHIHEVAPRDLIGSMMHPCGLRQYMAPGATVIRHLETVEPFSSGIAGDIRREAVAPAWHGLAGDEPNHAVFSAMQDKVRQAHPELSAPVADPTGTVRKMLGRASFILPKEEINAAQAPQGQHDTLSLAHHAAHVITDSRQAQEDAVRRMPGEKRSLSDEMDPDDRRHGHGFAWHYALALDGAGHDEAADHLRGAYAGAQVRVADHRHALGLRRDFPGSDLSPHMPPDLSHLPEMPESQRHAVSLPHNHRDGGMGALLDVARNPEPGTRIWRGERRETAEHTPDAESVGMHWSVHPSNTITDPYRRDEGERPVVWQARLEHPERQTIPRSHPMWNGVHMSMDSEAEVRLRPGSSVHVEGAWVGQPGGASRPVYPLSPGRNGPGWEWHPVDHHIPVSHRPGNGHTIDYSDVGIPKEAATSSLSFTYAPATGSGSHSIVAHPDGAEKTKQNRVGRISWADEDSGPRIVNLWVHPDIQRRGVATEMYRRAREIAPDLRHSANPTEDGRDWISGMERKTAVTGYDNLTKRSGMIYLDLPEGAVRHLPGGVDDHHITLVYLGKNVSDEQFEEALRRAKEAAGDHPPMEGSIGGLGSFPPSDSSEGKTPVFVPVDVPGLRKLRRSLEDLSGSEFKKFVPHVTRAYLEEGDAMPAPHPTVPVSFGRLHVKRGDEIKSFPFGGQLSKTADWDRSGSADYGVYLRFGHWPHDERSTNWVTGDRERGVSAYALDSRGEPVPPQTENELDYDPEHEMHGRVRAAEVRREEGIIHPDKTAHLVRGEHIGTGYDGEPLLKNVRRVGDWIDHRHQFIYSAGPHHLARDEASEDYEPPEESPSGSKRTAFIDKVSGMNQQPEFFWGSRHDLPPGTHINPEAANEAGRRYLQSGEKHVFYTDDMGLASTYGPNVYRVRPAAPPTGRGRDRKRLHDPEPGFPREHEYLSSRGFHVLDRVGDDEAQSAWDDRTARRWKSKGGQETIQRIVDRDGIEGLPESARSHYRGRRP